jgi:uncharacterized protein YegJ (DUF2314 family)
MRRHHEQVLDNIRQGASTMIGKMWRNSIFSPAARRKFIVKPSLILAALFALMGIIAPRLAQAQSTSVGGGTLSWITSSGTERCNQYATYTHYEFSGFSFQSSTGVVTNLSGNAMYYQWNGSCASGTPQGATPSSLALNGPNFTISFYPSSGGSGSATYTPVLSLSLAVSGAFTYGGTVTLTATISSGPTGAVSFYDGTTFLGTGNISGTTAIFTTTYLAAGQHYLKATWPGNSSYAALTSYSMEQTISPAPVTVTASNASRIYGAGNPALNYSYSAFANNQTSSVITGGSVSVSTSAGATSSVGNYPITASGSLTASNYSFIYQNGTLYVTQAPLTVSANNLSRTYGAPNPALTYSVYGLLNGDTTSGTASLTTTAQTSSGAGSYPITFTGTLSASANYSVTYSNGTLTVNKAVLTVTSGNAISAVGLSNLTFAPPAITGFVNNDPATVVNGVASQSTTAKTSSLAGTYPITPAAGTLSAANYTFSFVNGTLTVMQNSATTSGGTLFWSTNTGTQSCNSNATYTYYQYSSFIFQSSAGVLTPLTGSAMYYQWNGTCAAGVPQGSVPTSLPLNGPNFTVSFYPGTGGSGTASYSPLLSLSLAVSGTFTYGGTVTLTATISNGPTGVVTFYDNGVAITGGMISNNTATLQWSKFTAGSHYFVATWPGNSNYAALTSYSVNQVISPAPVTVTASNTSRAYGAANPALTYTYNGFMNGDTASVLTGGTVTLNTNAGATSPVNSYPISISGSLTASNYTFNYQNGTLYVTQAPLTVTATSLSKTYGTPNPVLTYSLIGLLNGDTTSGSATLATTAQTPSGAGSYPITFTGTLSASSNYNVTYANGTLTVNPAILTVTSGNAISAVGLSNLTFAPPAITGFVNNDPATVVNGVASQWTTAKTSSPAGNYPITPAIGTLFATNYTFAFVSGTLNVMSNDVSLAGGMLYWSTSSSTNPSCSPSGGTFTTYYYSSFVFQSNSGILTSFPAASILYFYPVGCTSGYPSGPSSAPITMNGSSYIITFTPGINGGTATYYLTQYISLSALPSTTTYGAKIPLSTTTGPGLVTASSGLPVTVNVTGPATWDGSNLTMTDIGQVTVTASQAGNAIYAATSSTQPIQVNPAPQTINFIAPSTPVNFGVAPITLAATASSKLPVTFTATGSAIAVGSFLTITGVGPATITANQAGNTDYAAATPVTYNIMVQAGPATLSLESPSGPSILNGLVNFVATTSEGLNGATITFYDGGALIGSATVNGTIAVFTTSSLALGNHTITAQFAGNADYIAVTSASIVQKVNQAATSTCW